MPHTHPAHNSHHTHPTLTQGRALTFTLVITTAVMLLEFIYGWLSGSLALISDALHMASHSIAALISLIAVVISQKPSNSEKTFGFQRSEVLAALINGITLIPIGLWIVFESFERYRHPRLIESTEMLVVAIIGLITNALTLWVLHQPSQRNLNLTSVLYHVFGDLFSSIAVVLAAILIYFKSWVWLDPTVSILVSMLILFWGISTILKSTHILMESKPKQVNLAEVQAAIQSTVPGCISVHDIHVWEITQHEIMLTAHVVTQEPLIGTLQAEASNVSTLLKERFGIGHATLQYETTDCGHDHVATN